MGKNAPSGINWCESDIKFSQFFNVVFYRISSSHKAKLYSSNLQNSHIKCLHADWS